MHLQLVITITVLCTFFPVHATEEEVKIVNQSVPTNCSDEAEPGSVTVLHYVGYLSNGTEFESSKERFGGPLTHTIGSGHTAHSMSDGDMIPGFDQGIIGMCLDENRTFTVPASLAYGDKGLPGKVPPGETLTYKVYLLDLVYPPSYHIMFQIIDVKPKDGKLSQEEMQSYFLSLLERRRKHHPGLQFEDVLGDEDETMEKRFQEEDKDEDGFLSEVEFIAARRAPIEDINIPTDEEIQDIIRMHKDPIATPSHEEF